MWSITVSAQTSLIGIQIGRRPRPNFLSHSYALPLLYLTSASAAMCARGLRPSQRIGVLAGGERPPTHGGEARAILPNTVKKSHDQLCILGCTCGAWRTYQDRVGTHLAPPAPWEWPTAAMRLTSRLP